MNTFDKAYEGRKSSESRLKDKSPKGFFYSAYVEIVAVGRSIGEAFHVLKPPGKKGFEKNDNELRTRNPDGVDSLVDAAQPVSNCDIMRIKSEINRIYDQTIPDYMPVTESRIEKELAGQLELSEQVYELRRSTQKRRTALYRCINDPDQTAPRESRILSEESINDEIDSVTGRSDIDEENKIHVVFDRRRLKKDMCRAFASALNEYLQPVEVMVGKVLRGKSDTESMAALLGMLLSLRSVSSRMGFETLQELLDQLYLRLLIVDGDPRVPITHEIRVAILRDVFKLRAIAGQMSEITNKTRDQSV